MPISEDEWEEASEATTWYISLLEYLEDAYPEACSAREIHDEMFAEDDDNALVNAVYRIFVMSELELLVSHDLIEVRRAEPTEDLEIDSQRFFRSKPEQTK